MNNSRRSQIERSMNQPANWPSGVSRNSIGSRLFPRPNGNSFPWPFPSWKSSSCMRRCIFLVLHLWTFFRTISVMRPLFVLDSNTHNELGMVVNMWYFFSRRAKWKYVPKRIFGLFTIVRCFFFFRWYSKNFYGSYNFAIRVRNLNFDRFDMPKLL